MKHQNQKLSFSEKVLMVVKDIKRGTVSTYKEVAEKAGSPRAYRMMGTLMKHNYDKRIPCHRVIKSDGTLGEYNRGGPEAKKRLLQKEGVILKNITIKQKKLADSKLLE